MKYATVAVVKRDPRFNGRSKKAGKFSQLAAPHGKAMWLLTLPECDAGQHVLRSRCRASGGSSTLRSLRIVDGSASRWLLVRGSKIVHMHNGIIRWSRMRWRCAYLLAVTSDSCTTRGWAPEDSPTDRTLWRVEWFRVGLTVGPRLKDGSYVSW